MRTRYILSPEIPSNLLLHVVDLGGPIDSKGNDGLPFSSDSPWEPFLFVYLSSTLRPFFHPLTVIHFLGTAHDSYRRSRDVLFRHVRRFIFILYFVFLRGRRVCLKKKRKKEKERKKKEKRKKNGGEGKSLQRLAR